MSWLNLHRIAAARGDGLDPRLLGLLEGRAAIGSAHPALVDLADYRDGLPVQAGPSPMPAVPVALADNIVRLDPMRRADRPAQGKRTSNA